MNRLTEIEKRVNKATPGPWVKKTNEHSAPSWNVISTSAVETHESKRNTGKYDEQGNMIYETRGFYETPKIVFDDGSASGEYRDVCDANDCDFLLNAPEDIRYLLDEIKRLQKEQPTNTKRVVKWKNGMSYIDHVPQDTPTEPANDG